MAGELLIVALAGGGVAAYSVIKDDDSEPMPVSSPAAIPKDLPMSSGAPAAVVKTQSIPIVNSANNSGVFNKPGTGKLDPIGLSQYVDQMQTELTMELKGQYDKLTSSAKKAGADILNAELKLSPPLKGDESFKVVASRTGAAAGGAVGAAACAATGYGAAAAPLCAMAGAYIGKKLGPAVAKYAKTAVKKTGKAVKKIAKKLKFW